MKNKENKKKRKALIVTMGCDKNKVDSESIARSLISQGFAITEGEQDADIIIVNSCSFIQSATEESLETFFQAIELKKKRMEKHPLKVILSGCMPGRYKKETLEKDLQEADLITSPEQAQIIGEIIKEKIYNETPLAQQPQNLSQKNQAELLQSSEATNLEQGFAFLKIAEGCNHKCTFCVIPAIRGKQKSQTIESIVQDAKTKTEKGIKEIILVAQDTIRYGQDLNDGSDLLKLVKKLVELPKLKWLRLMYMHPDYLDDALLKFIAQNDKCVKYLDIPFQHVSKDILKKMGRPGNEKKYHDLVKKIRKIIPGVAIRTSFIVGFPSETTTDFQELKQFVLDLELERVGLFKYSNEESTKAFDIKPKINSKTTDNRFDEIMLAQKDISQKGLEKYVGQTVDVLIETGENGEYVGRSQWDAPEVDGQVFVLSTKEIAPGSIVAVQVTGSLEYDLLAEYH